TDPTLTVYFPIADTGQTAEYRSGDDGSFINTPNAIDLQVMNDYSGSDDVVLDNVSKLMWTKCTATGLSAMDTADDCSTAKQAMSWQDAKDMCEGLTYADFSDWRLPTASELFSITDFGFYPYINTTVFPAIEANKYWISTISNIFGFPIYGFLNFTNSTDSGDTDRLNVLNYDIGTGPFYVRCVRGPE
ncbi:MAG TPA: DUF1566 domain-containing protein, partial [Spirochaetes bacterium]|nr:DUF1566 domain-containing protein [Spirochaetota bacterium]